MLMIVALALASSPACVDVKRECRACTTANGKQRCSNAGIACQPLKRICRPKTEAISPDQPASTRGR
jgi:phosphoribosyl 1,2-cyclic phosphodiesterase